MENKKLFIRDLSRVLSKHDIVKKLEYKKCFGYYEEVIITYCGGFTQRVNVTADSLTAMIKDIFRQGDL